MARPVRRHRAALLDPERVRQVLLNLVVNARDAMDGEGTLTVRTGREGECALVEIADTGPGIPAELRARAADPEFLGFVLDFLLQSDAFVLDFAAEAGVSPETPARARAALPGGAVPDWS